MADEKCFKNYIELNVEIRELNVEFRELNIEIRELRTRFEKFEQEKKNLIIEVINYFEIIFYLFIAQTVKANNQY